MTEKELTLLLDMTSKIYSNFEVSDEQTFILWYTLLQDTSFQVASENLRQHMQTSEFAPKPVNLIGKQEDISWHRYQQIEEESALLQLKEYHESEEVKPMPDYVKQKLAALGVNRGEEQ